MILSETVFIRKKQTPHWRFSASANRISGDTEIRASAAEFCRNRVRGKGIQCNSLLSEEIDNFSFILLMED